jgi:hypothetical protein
MNTSAVPAHSTIGGRRYELLTTSTSECRRSRPSVGVAGQIGDQWANNRGVDIRIQAERAAAFAEHPESLRKADVSFILMGCQRIFGRFE